MKRKQFFNRTILMAIGVFCIIIAFNNTSGQILCLSGIIMGIAIIIIASIYWPWPKDDEIESAPERGGAIPVIVIINHRERRN